MTAGLRGGRGVLRWYAPAEEAPTEATHERGAPWGPGMVDHMAPRRRELTLETANQVGAMLAAENRRSVDHRYNETEMEDFYTFTRYPGSGDSVAPGTPQLDPVQVLKAIACYEYQSCEHPEWETSEAHEFCIMLRHATIARLPGYEAAAWEIPPVKKPQRVVSHTSGGTAL